MAQTSQQLATAAGCLSSCLPQNFAWYGLLAVLDAIGQGDTVPNTAQEIATASECYASCIPIGLLPYALIVAAQNIASASAGGGGVTCGSGDPVAAPSGACGLYVDKDAPPSLWAWDGAAWQQLIA